MSKASDDEQGERIAKFLARAGIASRRDAERLIEQGLVAVDGATLTSPAFRLPPGARVTVNGAVIGAPAPTRLWRYHKPRGLVTSHRDERGRPTVFDNLPRGLPRVVSIGRLDINSEGLLLLTNDGALARRLELPSTGWLRHYRVRVFGTPDAQELARLAEGITVDGVHYRGLDIAIDRVQGGNAWLDVGLREGKNREIKRVLEALHLKVNRLIRTSYGPFTLGKLAPGAAETVPARMLAEVIAAR